MLGLDCAGGNVFSGTSRSPRVRASFPLLRFPLATPHEHYAPNPAIPALHSGGSRWLPSPMSIAGVHSFLPSALRFFWGVTALSLPVFVSAQNTPGEFPHYCGFTDHSMEPPTAEQVLKFRLSGGPARLALGDQKITVVLQDITFTSDYDNGSLRSMTNGGTNIFNGSLFVETGEKGNSSYWYRFRATGVAGRTITINLTHTQNPRPVVKFGDGPWRRSTAAEAPTTSRLVYSFPANVNEAEFAFFFPQGVQEIYDEVDALVAASPWATIAEIGRSTQNRPLKMVTVNDTRYPDSRKVRVWMHARAHSGEVTSTWSMMGFLQQVLSEDNNGRRLRQNVIFHIVPIENVDGVFQGMTRWDTLGIDQESEWCSANLRPPEVRALKAQIDALMATPVPIKVALNMHSTVGDFADTFFFRHNTQSTRTPPVPATYTNLQQSYINAFNAATPLFNNLSPGTSNLNPCTFPESYFFNNWLGSVMAITYEGHYYERITDGDWITGDDYKELGRALARGLFTFLNLPALEPEPEFAWMLQ